MQATAGLCSPYSPKPLPPRSFSEVAVIRKDGVNIVSSSEMHNVRAGRPARCQFLDANNCCTICDIHESACVPGACHHNGTAPPPEE